MITNLPGDDIYIIAAVKGRERYVWLYTADQLCELRRSVWRMAMRPGFKLFPSDAQRLMAKVLEVHAK